MKRISFLIVLIVFTFIDKAAGQSGWFALFGNDKLKNGFNLHYEAQMRNHNALGELDQLLLRTGVGYSFSENTHNFLVGYGFIHNRAIEYFDDNLNETEQDEYKFNEHRIFQQYIMKQRASRLIISHRYRLEERIFRSVSSYRFRYFLSAYVPINNPEIYKGTFYAGGYNELFINFGKTSFDRNRTYFSIGYAISDQVKVEAGYLRQNISNKNYQHFQISIFNSIDFKLNRQ